MYVRTIYPDCTAGKPQVPIISPRMVWVAQVSSRRNLIFLSENPPAAQLETGGTRFPVENQEHGKKTRWPRRSVCAPAAMPHHRTADRKERKHETLQFWS